MEAHASTVRIPTGTTAKPRRLRRLFQLVRQRYRARHERAIQTHDATIRSIPGSEHTHLVVLPPKAY
jgi:hypothetical protein